MCPAPRDTDPAGRLPPWPPAAILEHLAAFTERLDLQGDDRFEIELTLTGGAKARGRLAQLAANNGAPVAVMATREPSEGLLWVSLSDLRALHVRHDRNLTDALQAASAPPVDAGEAPSRLALNRRAEAIARAARGSRKTFKVTVQWDSIPDDAQAAHNVGLLLEATDTALGAIARDSLGQSALVKVKVFEIASGDSAQLQVERPKPDTLRIVADLRRPLPSSLERDLLTEVERIL